MAKKFSTFDEFYPFYLDEHSDRTNRTLHFIGTCLVIILALFSIITAKYKVLWLCPLAGYLFAWVGHFVFEKNRPATFKQPIFSLMADFKMWWQLITRKIKF